MSKKQNEINKRLRLEKIAQDNNCIITDLTSLTQKSYMQFICSCGNKTRKRIDAFITRPRCIDCGVRQSNSKHAKIYSEDEVRNYFKKYGYQLISSYKNSYEPIETICPNNHNYTATFSSFKHANARCKKCTQIYKQGYSPDEVEKIFAEENCLLLNKNDYEHYMKSKLEFICSCGEVGTITLFNFQKGTRCPSCKSKKHSITHRKYNEDDIIKELTKYGFRLKSEYISTSKEIIVECEKGHEWHTTFKNMRRREFKCLKCKGSRKYFKHEIPDLIRENGCELIGEYKNASTKFKFLCSCGETGSTRLYDFLRGTRCNTCSQTKTKESRRRNRIEAMEKLINEE